jgi:hypothetical protein
MSRHDLDYLLARMPDIATAVNGFSSECIQKKAFSALLSALADERQVQLPEASDHLACAKSQSPQALPDPLAGEIKKALAADAPCKMQATRAIVASGDLKRSENSLPHPKGTTAFRDFAAEKQPADNQERFAVAIYWLKENSPDAATTREDVRSLFQTTKDWIEPRNLTSALSVCASRKGTIDASNGSDIKLTPRGRQFVENELPKMAKKGRSRSSLR